MTIQEFIGTTSLTLTPVAIVLFLSYRNDKKMDRLLTGVGDGCDSCLAPRSMWTNIDAIREGFVMNRSIDVIRDTWARLPRTKDGQVKRRTGDYNERQGLCTEPKSLRETFSFTITHKVEFEIEYLNFKCSFSVDKMLRA